MYESLLSQLHTKFLFEEVYSFVLTVRNIKGYQDEIVTVHRERFMDYSFYLCVAILVGNLADATGIKFQQMTQRIEQVGTP